MARAAIWRPITGGDHRGDKVRKSEIQCGCPCLLRDMGDPQRRITDQAKSTAGSCENHLLVFDPGLHRPFGEHTSTIGGICAGRSRASRLAPSGSIGKRVSITLKATASGCRIMAASQEMSAVDVRAAV